RRSNFLALEPRQSGTAARQRTPGEILSAFLTPIRSPGGRELFPGLAIRCDEPQSAPRPIHTKRRDDSIAPSIVSLRSPSPPPILRTEGGKGRALLPPPYPQGLGEVASGEAASRRGSDSERRPERTTYNSHRHSRRRRPRI